MKVGEEAREIGERVSGLSLGSGLTLATPYFWLKVPPVSSSSRDVRIIAGNRETNFVFLQRESCIERLEDDLKQTIHEARNIAKSLPASLTFLVPEAGFLPAEPISLETKISDINKFLKFYYPEASCKYSRFETETVIEWLGGEVGRGILSWQVGELAEFRLVFRSYDQETLETSWSLLLKAGSHIQKLWKSENLSTQREKEFGVFAPLSLPPDSSPEGTYYDWKRFHGYPSNVALGALSTIRNNSIEFLERSEV
jgi:hypothetical protein